MQLEHVHFIINPAAGKPEPILSKLNDALQDAQIEWDISITTPQKDGAMLAREAVDGGADAVFAYGGDGTVYSVINGVAESGVPLGLLHGGTGNALAHDLDIPTDLTEAVQTLVQEPDVTQHDLGRVEAENGDSNYFALRSNVGLHNIMLQNSTPELKEQVGNLGYLIAGLKALPQSKSMAFHLTIDGETHEADGLTCMVVNSAAVGGPFRGLFATNIDPADGALDVIVLDSRFESLVSLLNSSLEADFSDYAYHWQGRDIEIKTDEAIGVTLDGEEFCDTPASIHVVPKGLKLLIPSNHNANHNGGRQ